MLLSGGRVGDPVRQQARAVDSEPAPLPTAQNVTVDEVISAYRQACQKLNCRQIPKLLRQLQVWGLWAMIESVCSACMHASVCARACIYIYVAQPWTQPSLPQP